MVSTDEVCLTRDGGQTAALADNSGTARLMERFSQAPALKAQLPSSLKIATLHGLPVSGRSSDAKRSKQALLIARSNESNRQLFGACNAVGQCVPLIGQITLSD